MYADNFSQVAQAINEHRYPQTIRRRIRDEGFWRKPQDRRSRRHRPKDRSKAA